MARGSRYELTSSVIRIYLLGNGMKENILKIIESAISGAEDNLIRAKMQFNPATQDLSREYGQSGRSCQSILNDYQEEYDELISAKKWLNDLSA